MREHLQLEHRFEKIDELPFDFSRRRMSVVLTTEEKKHLLICKGAVPIPGAKNAAQAEQNAGALGWRLAPDEVAALGRVAKFGQRRLFNRIWQHG